MDGIDTLTPASEPEGWVQLMLMPPKPAISDFNAQFAGERSSME